jgi:hypothetical protein
LDIEIKQTTSILRFSVKFIRLKIQVNSIMGTIEDMRKPRPTKKVEERTALKKFPPDRLRAVKRSV